MVVKLALLAALTCGISPETLLADQGSPVVEWYDVDDQPMGGSAGLTRNKLAETDLTPRQERLFAQASSRWKPAKIRDGRLATGVGYNAWFDGKRVHVTTMLLIPKDPNLKLTPGEEPPPGFFAYTLLARFTLALGEARRLDELKKYGWPPITIRVHPPGWKH